MENNNETATIKIGAKAADVPKELLESMSQGISELRDLGFSRADAVYALAMFKNDKEKAAEYLLGNSDQSYSDESYEDGPLDFLFDVPNFEEIRRSLLENPANINAAIQQLSASNPAVLAVIVSHPEEFLQILLSDPEEEEEEFSVEITEKDTQAIGRLVAEGHSDLYAAQAYFACGKKEKLALDLLNSGDVFGN